MFEEMRAGRVGPRGGLYITMRHLDPVMVRKEFKGMVERCVPTAVLTWSADSPTWCRPRIT